MENYEPASNLLEGRLIMVTGAGDGIGKTAAMSYAAHGATVILLGKTIKKLEKVYDEIESAGYPEAVILPLDLQGATAADYATVAERIEEDFGRLDGLLHNAGILGDLTPLEHYDPETWNKVMQVNLTAEFLLTQAMIPLLRASQDSSVIFTSSSVGRKGRAHWGAYAVSKFATEGLMETLADEMDDKRNNARVNSLNPGATRTYMRHMAYPAEDPGRNPKPEAIMGTYLYLMGPDSRGITGEKFDAQVKR
ncbi:YciK family oxidoreductase [Halospina denitrificans]|uniref:YciK family oxidoreductase n=1 Tax=Halospina denitrificans TaxID=332522 RepID=UPI00105B3549|nr:YciK family oxidoreductase [Halospina denitrificans]